MIVSIDTNVLAAMLYTDEDIEKRPELHPKKVHATLFFEEFVNGSFECVVAAPVLTELLVHSKYVSSSQEIADFFEEHHLVRPVDFRVAIDAAEISRELISMGFWPKDKRDREWTKMDTLIASVSIQAGAKYVCSWDKDFDQVSTALDRLAELPGLERKEPYWFIEKFKKKEHAASEVEQPRAIKTPETKGAPRQLDIEGE